jgi:hypothetical protein
MGRSISRIEPWYRGLEKQKGPIRHYLNREIRLHRINQTRAMSLDLAKQLVRQIEFDVKRYMSQRHPQDREIIYAEVLAGLRVWTPEFPKVQVTVDFSKAPIFAVVLYAHVAEFGKGRDWTRQIVLEFDADDNYCFVYDLPDLSQDLLLPLMDVNFRPPEH